MARYVDGFVRPVPKKNVAAYRKMARNAGKLWIEHGALEYRECIAEDVKRMIYGGFEVAVDLRAGR